MSSPLLPIGVVPLAHTKRARRQGFSSTSWAEELGGLALQDGSQDRDFSIPLAPGSGVSAQTVSVSLASLIPRMKMQR